MVIIKITIDLYGEQFMPSLIKDDISEPFRIVLMEDATLENSIGLLSIQHPNKIGVEYRLVEYYQWYVSFIHKHYYSFKKWKVENVNLFINVFYNGQCNFEIFDVTLLHELGKYKIAMPISVYNLTLEQLKEILYDENYTSEEIKEIFQYD